MRPLPHPGTNSEMLSSSDVSWLQAHYPSLHYNGIEVKGELPFRMSYHRTSGNYTLFPPASHALDESMTYETDSYEIAIKQARGASAPLSYDLSGRIAAAARNHQVSKMADMHINTGGDFCLAPPQQISLAFSPNFSLKVYIEEYLIPFLFLQTHFRKTGHWAWATSGHGLSGILEWYQTKGLHTNPATAKQLTLESVAHYKSELQDTLLQRLKAGSYKGHMPCLCGGQHKIRNCSRDAQYALNSLRKDIIHLLISV